MNQKLKRIFSDDPETLRALEQKEILNELANKKAEDVPLSALKSVFKGDKGDSPVLGVDYFTESDKAEIKKAVTPIKYQDYFTEQEILFIISEIKDVLKQEVTPVKGVDYRDGKDGQDADEEKIIKVVLDSVLKKLPKAETGFLKEKDLKDELKTLEEKLREDMPNLEDLIKELKKGKHIELRDIKNMPLNMNDMRWHGGGGTITIQTEDGLTSVSPLRTLKVTNGTLTDDGDGVASLDTGGGGSTITLETNGTPNGDQTLLNLVEGTNMTITDDGFGNITFDSTGGFVNPMTTLGDIIYGDTGGTPARLAANSTSNPLFLYSANGAAPSWQPLPVLGALVYYWTPTASDVATYYQQTSDPYATINTFTTAGVINGQLLRVYETNTGNPNRTSIPDGQYSCHIHANVVTTVGKKNAYLYAEVWETDSNGVDIALIATLGPSTILTNTNAEYFIAFNTAQYDLASTSSRIATKVYATISGAGGAPDIQISVGDGRDSRTNLPAPIIDASNYVPYVGATTNVNLGANSLYVPNIYNVTGGDLAIASQDEATPNALNIGSGNATSGDNNGATFYLRTGAGSGIGNGGTLSVISGDAGTDGNGGLISLLGGTGGSASGTGGQLTLTGGNGGVTGGQGGNIVFTGGTGTGSNAGGRVLAAGGVGSSGATGGSFEMDSGDYSSLGNGGDITFTAGVAAGGSNGRFLFVDGGGQSAQLNTGSITGDKVFTFPNQTGIIVATPDPNANTIYMWDDTDGLPVNVTLGTGLTYTHATHTLAASGSGDVVGPGSATDNAITRFDGTTGKLIQNSTVTLDDSGNFTWTATADMVLPVATPAMEFKTSGSSQPLLTLNTNAVFGTGVGRVGINIKNYSLFDDNTDALQIQTETTDDDGLTMFKAASGGTGNTFISQLFSRGTLTTRLAAANNDHLGRIAFGGYDGSTMYGLCGMDAYVDGTVGTGDIPNRLTFSTLPASTSSPIERMRITSTGLIRLYNTSGGNYGVLDMSGIASSNKTFTFPNTTGTFALVANPTTLTPLANDGAALGTTALQWSDLFLASGGVINFANGDVVATHSTGILTIGTGTLKITNPTNTSTSVVTIDGTQTLTNKRITKRVTTAADATSITPNTDSADITSQTNTQATGTLTINADSGTPTDGQSWMLRIKSTNVQTFSWNSLYIGGTVALPATTTGSSKIDMYTFTYSTVNSKWMFTGSALGFT